MNPISSYRFHEFCTVTENFCGEKISSLRVTNAPELIKGKLQIYCKTAGIAYEKTVPDSPSQNGVTERCNLTLTSITHTLLIDADLSDWYWPFAIQTAVHIKNRAPHASIPIYKTPFELWHGYKPSLIHLRPFGAASCPICSPNSNHVESPAAFSATRRTPRGISSGSPGPSDEGGGVKVRRDVTFHGFPPSAPPSVDGTTCPLWDHDIPFPKRLIIHIVLYASSV